MNKNELKERIARALRERQAELQALTADIFAEPELGYKEVKRRPR